MKKIAFLQKLVLFSIWILVGHTAYSQNVLIVERDTFFRVLTVETTAARFKTLKVALPAINEKIAIHGMYVTLKFDQSGKTINPTDTTCKIDYDQYALRLYIRKGGPKFPKQAPEVIVLPGEDCVEYVEVPGEDCVEYVEVPGDSVIIDRTPKDKKRAKIVPRIYELNILNVPSPGAPAIELGAGGSLTQYYLYQKNDSLAPWMQRALQVMVNGESTFSLYADEGPTVVTCDTCNGIREKQKAKMRVGSTNRIGIYLEFRGKHLETRKAPAYECRGYIGPSYLITEVFEQQTVNRKEDGLQLVGGFSAFVPTKWWAIRGLEFQIQGATRPFADWQTNVQLRALVHFGKPYKKGGPV